MPRLLLSVVFTAAAVASAVIIANRELNRAVFCCICMYLYVGTCNTNK